MSTISAARSLVRTLRPDDRRAIALVSISVAVVGVSYGLSAAGVGFPLWQILLLAVAVFGASAEILFVGVIAAGGAPLAAAFAALLVNARALPYGMTVGTFLPRGVLRLLGAHLANDETVALAMSGETRERRRALFWVSGAAVALAWPLGALVGALLDDAVADPAVLGLDAVFPAVLLALAMPSLRNARTAAAASAGGVVALAVLPIAPLGLAPVLALAGLVVAGRRA